MVNGCFAPAKPAIHFSIVKRSFYETVKKEYPGKKQPVPNEQKKDGKLLLSILYFVIGFWVIHPSFEPNV